MLFKRPDIIKEITKRKLMWVEHVRCKQGSLIKQVIEEGTLREKLLGRPKLRWENCVKLDIIMIGLEIRWREVAEGRDKWYNLYLAVWS